MKTLISIVWLSHWIVDCGIFLCKVTVKETQARDHGQWASIFTSENKL